MTAKRSHRRGRAWWRRWSTWRRITAGAFLAMLVLGGFEWFPWVQGSSSATTVVGLVPFVDPLAAVEAMFAAGTPTRTLVIGTGTLVVAAVLLGPVFCGFVCPLGLVLDVNHALQRTVRRRVAQTARRQRVPRGVPGWIRYTVLGAVGGIALVGGLPLFQAVSPINLLVRAAVFGSLLGLFVVGLIVIVEWFVPRLWCRALCPLGALYAILGRWAPFRVRIDPAEAGRTPCLQCTSSCPMGIPVMEAFALRGLPAVSDPSCIRCGDCVDVCPGTVLRLGFRAEVRPAGSGASTALPLLDRRACGDAGEATECACGRDDVLR